jgi:hypothetical protein
LVAPEHGKTGKHNVIYLFLADSLSLPPQQIFSREIGFIGFFLVPSWTESFLALSVRA